MDLSHIKSYDELVTFLREFRNAHGDTSPYDFGGVSHLLGALLDNIGANALQAEFEEFHDRFTPAQIAIVRRITAHVHT